MKKTPKLRATKRPEPLGMPDGCRAEAWDRYAAMAFASLAAVEAARHPTMCLNVFRVADDAALAADALLALRDERFR